MKLHLPIFLRKAVLACFSLVVGCSLYSGSIVFAEALSLGSEDTLTIDYADAESMMDLENGTLQLDGATKLLLSNCGEGDGRIYTLLTGVSSLLDAEGNIIHLDSSNNAASLYFDTTQPGTGFWADAKLQLTADGMLQLVRYSGITIPEGYTTEYVYSTSGIVPYSSSTGKTAFLLGSDVTIKKRTKPLVIGEGGAWYFTNYRVTDLYSLAFIENEVSSTSSDAYGGAIYGGNNSTITLSCNESVTFSGNSVSSSYAYGGAIYGGDDSTIMLSNNGSVTFSGNSASDCGGAIYVGDDSTITLSNNGSVTFSGNSASCGGAIYVGDDNTITLSGNGSVEFSGNSGRAIYGSTITLSGNGSVTFSENSGRAIYGEGDTITLSDNGSVMFSGNMASSSSSSSSSGASSYGGAIRGMTTLSGNESVTFSGNTASSKAYNSRSYSAGGAIYGGTILLSVNGSVTFSSNSVDTYASRYSDAYGGAIYGDRITLSDNGNVTFSGNYVDANVSYSNWLDSRSCGGAIYGISITLNNNGIIEFSGNSVVSTGSYAYGGAIYGSTITLRDNGSVTFSGNSLDFRSEYSYGGAMYGGSNSTITLSDNDGSVTFSGNSADADYYASGGAMYGGSNSTITLSGNESVSFSGNSASSDLGYAYGGAIYGGSDSTITQSGNGSVTFSGNSADADSYAYGGAMYGGSNSTITLSDNDGSVTFSGNSADADYDASGGAIYGSTITLSGNGSVSFSENTASSSYSGYASGGAVYGSTITISGNGSMTFNGNSVAGCRSSVAYGGAIYSYGQLNIRNNDSVQFEKNAEVNNGTYRLRSIYAEGSGDVISLSAAEDKSIEFRDSVYIASDSTVELNADYTDAQGVVYKQQGDIIFTGKYTETHLNEILAADEAGRTATAEEILNSRTTEVCAMTHLYGGRLRVEDGAVYKGYGITAVEGSNATVLVKDATLSHAGYALSFHSGTVLQTEGVSYIDGNVNLYSGSTLNLGDLGNVREISQARINGGNFSVNGNVIYSASVDLNEFGEEGGIIILGTGTYSWNPEEVQASLSITWVDKVLGVSERLATNEQGNLIFGVRTTDSVTWDNATGDGLWNNRSANWVDSGYRFAYVQGTSVTFGKTGEGSVMLEGNIVAENVTVSSGAAYELLLQEGSSLNINGALHLDNDSSLQMGMGIAVSSLHNQGGVSVAGDVSVVGEISGAGEIAAAGNLTVGGNVSAGTLNVDGILSAASLSAETVQADSVFLTAEDTANAVSGNLTAASVSLASGASLEVGGTLTAAEVALQGTAKVLQVGAFGADAMNFALDRAALESLNLSGGDTGTIARADVAMGSGFTATLNGGTKPVQAAAYMYALSVNCGEVQLTADYVHDGLQVWSSGKWVGQSDWTHYYIAGYDAADGVETVDLGGDTVQGDSLFIAYEEGVRSSVVKNGTLEFDLVDMGGGQFELGEGAEVLTDKLSGKGETLVMHKGSVLEATELTLGTLALNAGEVTVKKATINAMSGTEGTLNILPSGKVTVKSDVTLTGLCNAGTLNLGKNALTVNALVDEGGDVTAGEVTVQSKGSLMASFDKLVADKVTVGNSIPVGRYTDDLSVGDGSAIGELVAEMLEVREGEVTLGRTDRATEQTLLNLDLQEDAALVLNQQTVLRVTDELSATEGAEVRLKKHASVSYGDLSIGNRGAATQVVLNAAELADGELSELSNAHVALSGSGERSIDYKLTNSSVENAGSGKLYVTHEENTLSGVNAATGDIAVMNQAMGLNLNELVVGEGVSFSAYRGETESPEQEAVVSVSQTVTFGAGAHINADLKLQSGVKVEMNGPVSMGSDLYLFSGMTLGGTMLESLHSAEQGQTVVLFSGIDTLYLDGDAQNAALTLAHGVNASDYFTNLVSTTERGYYLTYDNATPGEGVLSVTIAGMAAVPEPTTATLSLLALAALAARRRRK